MGRGEAEHPDGQGWHKVLVVDVGRQGKGYWGALGIGLRRAWERTGEWQSGRARQGQDVDVSAGGTE